MKPEMEQWKHLAGRFSLIPLNGKIPVEKGWQKWCIKKRPYDSKEFQGKNAGIACGPASNLLVLDVDSPEVTLIKTIG